MMAQQPYRYAVILHTLDDEGLGSMELLSRHRTKAATLRAWKREQKEADFLYDEEWHHVECYYWDENTGATGWFKADEYMIYPADQFGECETCQHRQRSCHERYADGRCKRIARAAKGPWRVYALVDPTDGRTRYIGSTEKPLQKRLTQHVCTRQGARGAWIAALRKQGLRPGIIEVARFDTWAQALRHEYHLINTLPDLTNGQKTHRAFNSSASPPIA